jgi:hypothetical protein
MAHFAEVIDGVVSRVLVVSNDITTIDGVEDEQRGIDFLATAWSTDGVWVQTFYGPMSQPEKRYHFAGPGTLYDAGNDAFHDPQRYPSWSLDENFVWQPPTPMPDDGKVYVWDEDTTSWVEVE